MTYEQSLKTTTEVLARHIEPPRAIAPHHEIQVDLGLDSLAVMEVVADIEDELRVHIPMDALSGLSTVEDVARALVTLAERSPR